MEQNNNDMKWYIFESYAEGVCADMALLSEEQAQFLKQFFRNKVEFYNEGYAGDYSMLSLGPFCTQEEAVKTYMTERCRDDCALLRQFEHMYNN